MPRYDYNCLDCLKEFEIIHSYKFTDVKCAYCGSDRVSKLLRLSHNYMKTVEKHKQKGSVVEDAIEDGKRELTKSKKELKGKVYKK